VGRISRSDIGAAAIAAVVVVGFALAGGTRGLSAHPWWAAKVGYIGAGIGAVTWAALLVAGMRRRWLLLVGLGVLVVAGIMTGIGKTNFAASYAEDALAGRFWYFGWIALMASGFGVIASLASGILRRLR